MSIGIMAGLLLVVSIVAVALIGYLYIQSRRIETARDEAEQAKITAENQSSEIKARFANVVDADAERDKVLHLLESQRSHIQSEIAKIREEGKGWIQNFNAQKKRMEAEWGTRRNVTENEISALNVKLSELQVEVSVLDELANLQSFGLYKPHYDFSSSAAYQSKLEEIRAKQKKMITDKTAAVGDIAWTVNGSATEGRKQINQTLKLLLRAFNGECDAAIAKVRYNNIQVMETRIHKAQETVNKLADVQKCRVTSEYLDLKMQELFLAHEYQEKVQAEKEEQRRIREQMREEEIAQRELERAKQDAEKEEQRYSDALLRAREEAARAVGAKQLQLQNQIAELEQRLAEAITNKERAISRAQMTKSGHVYIISNIGSFGEHVYKIGMTRRLEPEDRVRELGDASVPFYFDVHALIYSDDAPALENTLHRLFDARRINAVNLRREFFRVTLDEITEAVRKHNGKIEVVKGFVAEAEAKEWRQTQAALKTIHPISQNGLINGVTPVN